MLSRVDLFERIRRDRRVEPGVSVRELSRRHGVHRRTVREALASAVPAERKKPARPRSLVLEPVMGWIDQVLREDLAAPRKQRHTVRRIYDRLVVEHGFDQACYSTVCNYVNRRRPQIEAEARDGRAHLEGTVPQVHEPGAEAEVDFADVRVRLAGEPLKCHLFTLRLSYSGKSVHRVYASQSQEAFMQGHAEAFAVLGGIPFRHIRYDNLKPAVKQACFGRSRVESQRWTAFRSHYGFGAFYCMPGKDGAHEKGGVEHEGGRFRRSHLVPVPEVDTLAGLNERLAAIDAAEDARHVHGRTASTGECFAAERELLLPLPDEDFDYSITLTPTVRRDPRIVVRQCYYSVPARFIGQQVRVSLRASELLVLDRGQVIARYPRLTRRYDYRDTLDHYLEILQVRPGALAGSASLAQARADGSFTAAHDAFWAAARAAHGDAAGTRALLEVLLLHRRMPAETVIAGITAALEAGAASPELVAIEARKAAQAARDLPFPAGDSADRADIPGADPGGGPAAVISLAGRRTPIPEDKRPLPSVDAYDQLLSLRNRKGAS
jgi:transposase